MSFTKQHRKNLSISRRKRVGKLAPNWNKKHKSSAKRKISIGNKKAWSNPNSGYYGKFFRDRGSSHWRWAKHPSYGALHGWLTRKFGKADKCENLKCKGISRNYDYALIKGKKYERKRKNFIKLCKSCHVKSHIDEKFIICLDKTKKLESLSEKLTI